MGIYLSEGNLPWQRFLLYLLAQFLLVRLAKVFSVRVVYELGH